jgi:hypothetical protein
LALPGDEVIRGVKKPMQEDEEGEDSNTIDEVVKDGTECEVMLAALSWKDKEDEQKFKREGTTVIHVYRVGEDGTTGLWIWEPPAAEYWEQRLLRDGAVGWKDCYVDFRPIFNDWQYGLL